MKITNEAEVTATRPVPADGRQQRANDPATKTALARVTVEMPNGLSEDAIGRIQVLVARETQRIAEIGAVDLRDAVMAREEAERLATVPAERPVIMIGAKLPGDNAPASVAHFWRDKDGNLVPDSDAGAKRNIAAYAARAKAHPRGVPHVDDHAEGQK